MTQRIDIKHLHLTGSLGMAQAPSLRVQIIEALEGASTLKIDLGEDADIDASFLQMLIACRAMAAEEQKQVFVSGSGRNHLDTQIIRCGLTPDAFPPVDNSIPTSTGT